MNFIDRHVAERSENQPLNVPPFLKWAGGKRWLFKKYRHLFPSHVGRLIDPFLGGGSSFFFLQPDAAILADLNKDLIDLYCHVRDNPLPLARLLVHYHHKHNKKFYYSVRSSKPVEPLRKSAWLLYLNRTCWNGLFRVNLRGEFNVPLGTKTKIFSSIKEFDSASVVLKNATLLNSDFEAVIDCALKGDVVFADPPYFENAKSIKFLKYNSNVFSWNDQLRLREALIRASSRGAKCYLTNSNHSSLVDLYKKVGKIHFLSRHSVLAGTVAGRKRDTEILVEIS